MKNKEKTWIMMDWNAKSVKYVLDYTNLDVSNDELMLCIMEQVYGEGLK